MTKKQISSLELAQLSACWKRVPPARPDGSDCLGFRGDEGAVIKNKTRSVALHQCLFSSLQGFSVSSFPCKDSGMIQHALFIKFVLSPLVFR